MRWNCTLFPPLSSVVGAAVRARRVVPEQQQQRVRHHSPRRRRRCLHHWPERRVLRCVLRSAPVRLPSGVLPDVRPCCAAALAAYNAGLCFCPGAQTAVRLGHGKAAQRGTQERALTPPSIALFLPHPSTQAPPAAFAQAQAGVPICGLTLAPCGPASSAAAPPVAATWAFAVRLTAQSTKVRAPRVCEHRRTLTR